MTDISTHTILSELRRIRESTQQTLDLVAALEQQLQVPPGVVTDDMPLDEFWKLALTRIPGLEKVLVRIINCLKNEFGYEFDRPMNTVADLRALIEKRGSPAGKKWGSGGSNPWARMPNFGPQSCLMFRTVVETLLV